MSTTEAWPAWNKPYKLSDFDSSDSEDEYSVDETTTYEVTLLRQMDEPARLDPLQTLRNLQAEAFTNCDFEVKSLMNDLLDNIVSDHDQLLICESRASLGGAASTIQCEQCDGAYPAPAATRVTAAFSAQESTGPCTMTREVNLHQLCCKCLVQLPVIAQPRECSRLVEQYFPLVTPDQFEAGNLSFSNLQLRNLRLLADNQRRGKVSKPKLQKPAGGWRDNQRTLLGIETPAQMRLALEARRLVVFESLSMGYLAVRVAVMQIFISFTMECCQEWPFRMHWPESRGDDQLFYDFVTYLSMRYSTYACVRAALTHVIEFHMAYLGVHPPPAGFPMTSWFLQKLRLTMAKERPEGRKRRPGLPGYQVAKILETIWERLQATKSRCIRLLYVNVGAALAFCYEQAFRVGNVCPGPDFRPERHLSRTTIGPALIGREALKAKESFVIQPPVSKTTYASEAARERTNRPRLFDAMSEMFYAFGRWGPLLAELDPLGTNENPGETPAFRLGGENSPALTYVQTVRVMKLVAQGVVHDWENFDYDRHSLRIGRLNDFMSLKTTDGAPLADEEQMNAWSMHTTSVGREGYNRGNVEQELKLMRAAETARYSPVETVQNFPVDRSEPRPSTYMSAAVQPATTATADTATNDITKYLEEKQPLPNTTDPMQDHDLQSPMELQELETESRVHWSGQPTDRKSQSDMSEPPAAKRARMDSGGNKSRRRWDFRKNCFTTAPLPTVPISAAAKRSSLCEDCQLKSRNYGLPGQPRRWCGTCANKYGGTFRCK